MTKITRVLIVAAFTLAICGDDRAQSGEDLSWAFPVPDKIPPPAEHDTAPKQLAGSTKSYTQEQIDDQFNPPDWFPQEHPTPPQIVVSGIKPSVQACGSCHLMSGNGHPESASLAGLPVSYLMRQMADFKSGERKDPAAHVASQRSARMNGIAKAISDEDARLASEWFAALKPAVWYKVVETQTVPKTWVSATRMRLPHPEGGSEPIGNRIITVPQDAIKVELRDPRSGFIAYVPVGSIAKGQALVNTGGAGKTISCTICHGDLLQGLGDVPRIAGLHPIYIVRQLYNFRVGANAGTASALMKKVVANLTEDDMIALAAYAGSLAP